MKIGFFSDRYLPQLDGVAMSLENFRIKLEEMGHEVYIIAPASGLRFKETNKHVIRFRAVKGLFGEYDYMTSLFYPPAVTKQLDAIGLDIVHFHTPGQVGLLGAYYALHNDIPLFTTYHTDLYEYVKHYPGVLPGILALTMITPLITGGGMGDMRVGLGSMRPERSIDKWNQKLVERGVTLLNNYCDLVIAPSIRMEAQLKSWNTKVPITILQTGMNELLTTQTEINTTRQQYGIKKDDQVIFSIGRVGTEKNLDLLVDAFIELAPKRPHVKLVIGGDGPAREKLIAQAAASSFADRIIFPGRIEQSKLGSFFGLATVFGFPSLADTQGVVVNEAAMAGVPIVIIDRTVSEIVRDNVSGIYTGPSVTEFAAGLSEILDDPAKRDRLGAGAKKIASGYTASIQAAKLLRLYEEYGEAHHKRAKIKLPKQP